MLYGLVTGYFKKRGTYHGKVPWTQFYGYIDVKVSQNTSY
jgi:hypothetical protein